MDRIVTLDPIENTNGQIEGTDGRGTRSQGGERTGSVTRPPDVHWIQGKIAMGTQIEALGDGARDRMIDRNVVIPTTNRMPIRRSPLLRRPCQLLYE